MKITFIVYGEPRPASFSFGRGVSKTGKPFMWKSTKHANWMKAVALQALEHKPDELIRGIVGLTLVFWRRKPSGAGKDWLKAKTPERAAKSVAPVSKPDLTSLERPIEDALSGLFYRDDAQIQRKRTWKFYAEDDEPERVLISVEALPPPAVLIDELKLMDEFCTDPKQEDPWDAAANAQV